MKHVIKAPPPITLDYTTHASKNAHHPYMCTFTFTYMSAWVNMWMYVIFLPTLSTNEKTECCAMCFVYAYMLTYGQTTANINSTHTHLYMIFVLMYLLCICPHSHTHSYYLLMWFWARYSLKLVYLSPGDRWLVSRWLPFVALRCVVCVFRSCFEPGFSVGIDFPS